MITHLEPDILECEVKWALGSITTNKASGGDGIPVELFQILKDDVVKVLHSICQQIGRLSSGHRTGKGHFSFQSQRKAMPKNAQTTTQLHSSHILSKVVLKILQVRLQQYMNQELPDVPAWFRKGRGTRNQTANIHWIIEKAREFQKNIYFCCTDYTKAFDCVDATNCGNSSRDGNTRPSYLPPWEICMQVKKLELDMEQQTGSKLVKDYVKAVYCHPAYLTYMQSTSCEMLGWMKHRL